jgi:hypothetical protein
MNANVSIKPTWQGLMEFVNGNQENEIYKNNLKMIRIWAI